MKNGKIYNLSLGKAVALICSGAGIMLLLNCCIAFIVDNVRQNRKRNSRGSIIRRSRRQDRTRRVSFSNPLVMPTRKAHRVQPIPGQSGEEIEMIDLGPNIGIIPAPPLHPPPPAPPLRPTRPAPSIPAKPLTPMPGSMTQVKPKDFPSFAPPPPPSNLTRSMSTRLPHRDPSYKTLTIILC
jgi:hypothetical protein